MEDAQRRAHFRLHYPASERPALKSQVAHYEVVEVAEGGVRLVLRADRALQPGDQIEGEISFHDGECESVAGAVLRLDAEHVIVQLARGISQHRMMLEQTYIRKQFPAFLKKP